MTGSYDDGPEWGTQPYTNMFASDNGSVDPKYPVNTQIGDFLKQHGGTVLGSYGYSISPSSSRAADRHRAVVRARGGQGRRPGHHRPLRQRGLHQLRRSTAKQNDVNAMVPAMDNNSNYALATALKQAGVKLKAALFATGYEPDVINSPAWSTLAGRLLPVAVPTLLAAQCRHRADAGGNGEVRPLHQEPVPDLRPVRGVGGGRPDDQGPGAGGSEPDAAAVIKDLRG